MEHSLPWYRFSSNIAFKEHHYKLQHRWYWTPVRISKIFPDASTLCWRCKEDRATYQHVWWDCNKVRGFRKSLSVDMKQIIGSRLPFSIQIYLLHDFSVLAINKLKQLLVYQCVAAFSLLAAKWKRKSG